MKQRIFISPHWPNRPITTKVTDKFITFHFLNENDREFYWIENTDWVKDTGNIVKHMECKVWFTSDIRKFINTSLNLKDNSSKLRQDEWTDEDERLKQEAQKNGGYLSGDDLKESIIKKYFSNE